MSVLYGIDVSNAQARIDWDKVAAVRRSDGTQQYRFAIAKATEGHTYLDPYYVANREGIPSHGIVPGAYHFLRPLNGASVAAQADWFVSHADPNALHALDVEAAGPLDVRGWVARYRSHYPKKTLLIYTGPGLWKQISKVPYDGASFGPLWAAGYKPGRYVSGSNLSAEQAWAEVTGNAGLPWLGWDTWLFMQHSASGKVPGVPDAVDLDAFGGSLLQLKAHATINGGGNIMAVLDNDDKAWLQAQFQAVLNGLDDKVWGYPIGKSGLTAAQVIQNSLGHAIGAETAVSAIPGLDVDAVAAAVAAKLTGGVNVTTDPAVVKAALTEVLNGVAFRAGQS